MSRHINNHLKVRVGNRTIHSNELLYVDIPKMNTKFGDKNFIVKGGKLWNSIPEDIKRLVSVDVLKSNMRKYPGFD